MPPSAPKSERHFLYHGELSDAPGRNESWDEYVRYLGSGRWRLEVEGTDFSGFGEAEPIREVMSTKSLLAWILERDKECAESEFLRTHDREDAEDRDHSTSLGPRAKRLRDIAIDVGADYCVSCLGRWLSGRLPRARRRQLRLTDIKGVTQRGVWIGVRHRVLDVETDEGPGFLYPPTEGRMAKLVLKSETSLSAGRLVAVPLALMKKLQALMPLLQESKLA